MGNDTDACGIISEGELTLLVSLFDRSEFALDPTSRDAKEAKSDLSSLLDSLHERACIKGINMGNTSPSAGGLLK
jgi:hypothetical protein